MLESVQKDDATVGPQKGVLMLVGGGANRPAFIQRFVQLAGGSRANIVEIPTAQEEARLNSEGLEFFRKRATELFGVSEVKVLHTRDRKTADSAAFVEPLRHATGVWILGGNDEYLVDAYVGTRTEQEIKALVMRGGVMGGTSAGANIQGVALVNARIVDAPDGSKNKTVKIEGERAAFNLLTDAIPLPHWHRNAEAFALIPAMMATQGARLGIGIDEATAAVVQGDRLEVLGDGSVGIYDGKQHEGRPYFLLSPGQSYDLKKRTLIADDHPKPD
jgi:cyanophycinase